MLRYHGIFLLAFCLFLGPLSAQPSDTLRIMSYNLTNYGNNIDQCTAANNGLTLKNPAFKTIIKHLNPDVLGVCEMNTNPTIAGLFLSNVLNTDGISHFARSGQVVEPSGTLTSVLFYNTQKMVLAYQSKAPTQYRLTHHFRLYMKTAELAQGDTIWLNVLLCHLKAGTASSDIADRTSMALAIRNYLNGFPKKENCIIMGDFNFYRSSEGGFQTLTAANPNPTYQFQDPINRIGTWTSNASFADVHTQCPRTDNNGGCYSGGGLDDRFDFIFMNRHLLNDSAGIRYISGSYKAVGNDGLHFNSNINAAPANTSVPATVLSALYLASDHLPVMARLRVDASFLISGNPEQKQNRLSIRQVGEYLEVDGVFEGENLELEILDLMGRKLDSQKLPVGIAGRIRWKPWTSERITLVRIRCSDGRAGTLRVFGE